MSVTAAYTAWRGVAMKVLMMSAAVASKKTIGMTG